MKFAAVCLLAFVACAHGRTLLSEGDKPASPPYEVKNTTGALEIREYENATWAVAFGKSRWSIDFAARSAGLALISYFKGGNVDHAFLQPTTPLVATILRPPHPPHHKNGSHPEPPHHKNGSHPGPPHHKHHPPPGPPAVALAAYISSKGKAPIPDCPRVRILHTNSTEVYVHKFGGWAISWVVKHEIGHLSLALKDLGICPRKGKFFVATYDGPWKIFGRHNEIMWVKKPKHHHNDTLLEGADTFTFNGAVMGLEALDVEALFPDEFPARDNQDFKAGDDSTIAGEVESAVLEKGEELKTTASSIFSHAAEAATFETS